MPHQHVMLTAKPVDIPVAAPEPGDLLYGNASPSWATLGVGSEGDVLTISEGYPSWVANTPGGGISIGDAIGSASDGNILFVGTTGVLAQNDNLTYAPDVGLAVAPHAAFGTGALVASDSVVVIGEAMDTNILASGLALSFASSGSSEIGTFVAFDVRASHAGTGEHDYLIGAQVSMHNVEATGQADEFDALDLLIDNTGMMDYASGLYVRIRNLGMSAIGVSKGITIAQIDGTDAYAIHQTDATAKNSFAGPFGFFGVTPASRQAHIADPTAGTVQDAESRSAIASILDALEIYGLLATS